ncbi:MAG: hypothetical protein ACPGGA_00760 [Balneolaceae bacterium]
MDENDQLRYETEAKEESHYYHSIAEIVDLMEEYGAERVLLDIWFKFCSRFYKEAKIN